MPQSKSKSQKHIPYNIFRIEKSKQQQLLKSLKAAKMTAAGKKHIDGFDLTLYVATDPASPVWWTEAYHDYFQDQPVPKNELYYAVFLVTTAELCYAVTMGKAYQYVKELADPQFGINLAERIVDPKWKAQQTIPPTTDSSDPHSVTAPTVNDKWGDNITFSQSVQFDLPIIPDKLPSLIKKIETALAKPVILTDKIHTASPENATYRQPEGIEHVLTCLNCNEQKTDNYCTTCKKKTSHSITIVIKDPSLNTDTEESIVDC